MNNIVNNAPQQDKANESEALDSLLNYFRSFSIIQSIDLPRWVQ